MSKSYQSIVSEKQKPFDKTLFNNDDMTSYNKPLSQLVTHKVAIKIQLFNSKTNSFFDGLSQLFVEFRVRLVWRYVDSIEASVSFR